jgi:hypothetical protein
MVEHTAHNGRRGSSNLPLLIARCQQHGAFLSICYMITHI